MAFKLSPELIKKIREVHDGLSAEIVEMQEEWEGRPERWQEGASGTDVSAWLEDLTDLADTLDSVQEKP